MSINTESSLAINKTPRRDGALKSRPLKTAPRRTTITLSPQAQEIVERFRSANGTSTSAAIDRIIQRSEPKPSRLKNVNGFLVLDVPFRHVNTTLEDVKQAEDEMDLEHVERLFPSKKWPISKGNRSGKRQ